MKTKLIKVQAEINLYTPDSDPEHYNKSMQARSTFIKYFNELRDEIDSVISRNPEGLIKYDPIVVVAVNQLRKFNDRLRENPDLFWVERIIQISEEEGKAKILDSNSNGEIGDSDWSAVNLIVRLYYLIKTGRHDLVDELIDMIKNTKSYMVGLHDIKNEIKYFIAIKDLFS